MKKPITAAALLALCFVLACTKESGTVNNAPSPAGTTHGAGPAGASGTTAGRLSGTNYSQSISVDTANRMIASYLGSVGYPGVDTAIRSLSFDADTLRAYLQNPNIVTLKFVIAHQPAYINDGNFGKNAGMNPKAMTMVIVGLDNSQQQVLNGRSGVYEHFSPCPASCPDGVNDVYLHQ